MDGLDFEAIETAARREALRLAARAIERRFNADTTDHAGPTLPCACGQAARYAGRRDKTFTTALGELTLSRAYYYCEPCASGFEPNLWTAKHERAGSASMREETTSARNIFLLR